MSFYELSRWVIKRIDSLRKNFLWQGGEEGSKGYHLISWERVCKKNEFDGLEVLNLDDMNRALGANGGGSCIPTQRPSGHLSVRCIDARRGYGLGDS